MLLHMLVFLNFYKYSAVFGYLNNKIISKNNKIGKYRKYNIIWNYNKNHINNNDIRNQNINFDNLSRVELQKLAREKNINANMKSSEIINALRNLKSLQSNHNIQYSNNNIDENKENKLLSNNIDVQINALPNITSGLKEFLLIEKFKKGNLNI